MVVAVKLNRARLGLPCVTFDFDNTLIVWDKTCTVSRPNLPVMTLVRSYARTHRVYIVTARGVQYEPDTPREERVVEFVRANRLPVCGAIFTDGAYKWSVLQTLKPVKHYDDNMDELQQIADNCPGTIPMLVTPDDDQCRSGLSRLG